MIKIKCLRVYQMLATMVSFWIVLGCSSVKIYGAQEGHK